MVNELQTVGVLGSGSFGTAITKMLSENAQVLLYTRRDSIVESVNQHNLLGNIKLNQGVRATKDLSQIAETCDLIFPIIPSEFFRSVIKEISPYVGPGHIMIHGTKGLDVSPAFEAAHSIKDIKKSVFTMSEVIKQESSIIRTGALAGPNLAKEILEGQPAATVIASEFDEVIQKGRQFLSCDKFIVYGSHNLKGIELAGALKNVIAIASGLMNGIGFGKNMQALLITRGLREMIHTAQAVGAELRPFLGTAGIGDLIATATSNQSRNFTFGGYLSQGKKVAEIKEIMEEVAEGYRTIKFAHRIIESANINAPLIKILYEVAYEDKDVSLALKELIQNPLSVDVDFI